MGASGGDLSRRVFSEMLRAELVWGTVEIAR